MVSQILMVLLIFYSIPLYKYFYHVLGGYPTNMRWLGYLLGKVPGLSWLSGWIPGFVKVPFWLLHQAGNKF